jgi:hypothetical protein
MEHGAILAGIVADDSDREVSLEERGKSSLGDESQITDFKCFEFAI